MAEGRRAAGLSKLNSMHGLELRGMRRWPGPGSVDMLGRSGVAVSLMREGHSPRRRRTARFRSGTILVLPRKEVIQPHLPVRLPCYDFTPVTSPTFDGSLPKGLGHRLRVLLTPVV